MAPSPWSGVGPLILAFLCILASRFSFSCCIALLETLLVEVVSTILYIENPKHISRKLLELINEYSKVAGYKINMQKSLAFLYTSNEKTEREIKEAIPFTIAMKRTKYLVINIHKETKDLNIENYKTLMKEIKDGTNRWRHIIFLD